MLKRFFEAESFIFHVPKPIQVPIITSVGYCWPEYQAPKQLKPKIVFFSKNGWKQCQKMRLDALIIFLLKDDTRCLFWGVNYRNTEAKTIIKTKTTNMRLDALIIFLIEWRHKVLILRGKLSKYWSNNKHKNVKRNRRKLKVIWECYFKRKFEGNSEGNLKGNFGW